MSDENDPFMAEAHMMPQPPRWFSKLVRWFDRRRTDEHPDELFVGGRTTAAIKHNELFRHDHSGRRKINLHPEGSQHDGIDDAV